jgi:intracellular septation protein
VNGEQEEDASVIAEPSPRLSSGLRFFLDLLPLVIFFVAFKQFGIMTATAALMVCTCGTLLIIYLKERKLAPMPLVAAIVVGIFGTLTIALDNEQFIKLKPTIINLLFAMILLGGLCFKKPLLKWALSHAVQLEDRGWWILSLRWGLFFLFLAGLNECVWRSVSTETWVKFKVFGLLAITFIFTLTQVPLIDRYKIEPEKPSV